MSAGRRIVLTTSKEPSLAEIAVGLSDTFVAVRIVLHIWSRSGQLRSLAPSSRRS